MHLRNWWAIKFLHSVNWYILNSNWFWLLPEIVSSPPVFHFRNFSKEYDRKFVLCLNYGPQLRFILPCRSIGMHTSSLWNRDYTMTYFWHLLARPEGYNHYQDNNSQLHKQQVIMFVIHLVLLFWYLPNLHKYRETMAGIHLLTAFTFYANFKHNKIQEVVSPYQIESTWILPTITFLKWWLDSFAHHTSTFQCLEYADLKHPQAKHILI